ncbi:hypothetical protein TNCT_648361 [Trichonephila clavata]|uniref:Uncharacterized protein n=1 Tax=Trichonephila clavata TaxID=2740835 RepID=A0A8X6LRZ3_TRICU|nr:hypothetical protein TNCT_648361 [Trichonephila clavata]
MEEMMRSHGCCTDASLSCLRDRGDDLVLPFLPWGCNVNLALMEHSSALRADDIVEEEDEKSKWLLHFFFKKWIKQKLEIGTCVGDF